MTDNIDASVNHGWNQQMSKMYGNFNHWFSVFLEAVTALQDKAEKLDGYSFDGHHDNIYNKKSDVDDLNTAFHNEVMHHKVLLKARLESILEVSFDRFPGDIAEGSEGVPPDAMNALQDHEREALNTIGSYLRDFDEVFAEIKVVLDRTPTVTRNNHGYAQFMEAGEVEEAFGNIADNLDAIYYDFLGDSGFY